MQLNDESDESCGEQTEKQIRHTGQRRSAGIKGLEPWTYKPPPLQAVLAESKTHLIAPTSISKVECRPGPRN